MANVNKIKAQGNVYDIEDTVARTSALYGVPNPPSANGTYWLKCIVSNGNKSYQWVENYNPGGDSDDTGTSDVTGIGVADKMILKG